MIRFRDETLQCNINRAAGKTSGLSSIFHSKLNDRTS